MLGRYGGTWRLGRRPSGPLRTMRNLIVEKEKGKVGGTFKCQANERRRGMADVEKATDNETAEGAEDAEERRRY